jgi:hypothetical protein
LNRKTYTDTHIVGKANVPKALISKVKGTPVFEDIHPMVCKAMWKQIIIRINTIRSSNGRGNTLIIIL